MMNAGSLRRASLMGLVIITLLAMTTGALAQTKPRPKVVTNEASSYRYSYQHGYRAGYEDGFTKGKSDFNEKLPLDFENSEAYRSANRTYKVSMGTLAEYQEGYRIGFDLGASDGYYGRPYSISMPANLGQVVVAAINAGGAGNVAAQNTRPRSTDPSPTPTDVRPVDNRPQDTRPPDYTPPNNRRPSSSGRDTVYIPDGTQMKLRLSTGISTKTNREGDRFTATVLDPSEFADAVVEGHIAKLNKSGKATGKTELSLAFDSIRLRDGRSGRLAGQVERVYESETVKEIDEEGNVQTGSRTKDTAVRGVGGAALGAIIGGIAGGGKGAAIGAVIGGGLGAGSVYVQEGKDLVLDPGTELLIRTATPAREKN